jgi:hypothetical protein
MKGRGGAQLPQSFLKQLEETRRAALCGPPPEAKNKKSTMGRKVQQDVTIASDLVAAKCTANVEKSNDAPKRQKVHHDGPSAIDSQNKAFAADSEHIQPAHRRPMMR